MSQCPGPVLPNILRKGYEEEICCLVNVIFYPDTVQQKNRMCSQHDFPDKAPSTANMERTFIAVKPDGVQRGLCGDIIKRFEQRGFRLVAAKFMQASEEQMKTHYLDLKDMPFYAGLCKYMSSGPILAMVWEGRSIVKLARMMLGETNPADSKPGSIRGDLCIDIGRNIIHGSDTLDNAKREVNLWFKAEEMVDYAPCAQAWLYE
uniref:nucleoside diphosphate kinase A-like isoform X1 n=2 Tax=Doryrhamphus excisus TaxID=161450 RepID=UPI0025AE233F|nr:nucleoside diphosphate kinase A-like isoform X1 [Doryrhamphus excisus]